MGHVSGHKRSIKIGTYLKNAVTNAKGFITNKISSRLNMADLVSNFGATNVSSAQTESVAKLLDKSPFTPKKSVQQEWKDRDKLGFRHIQYPQELTGNELGNWMLFFMISNAGGHAGGVMDLAVASELKLNAGWGEDNIQVGKEKKLDLIHLKVVSLHSLIK